MSRSNHYRDLDGNEIDLSHLDAEEESLVDEIRKFANSHQDWLSAEYSNFWPRRVLAFYEPRGLTRRQMIQTSVYQVAQDIESRMQVAAGEARLSDYRDELETLIQSKFRTRREFCQATGLSEDMLSHVLAKRKHLAVDTLAEALGRIGYSLHIVPVPDVTQ
jgi:hypothetical protein